MVCFHFHLGRGGNARELIVLVDLDGGTRKSIAASGKKYLASLGTRLSCSIFFSSTVYCSISSYQVNIFCNGLVYFVVMSVVGCQSG